MFRFIQGIIEVVVAIWIIQFVFRLFAGRRQAPAGGRPRPDTRERLGGTLVRDPQCGTYLPESRAVHLSRAGTVLHFCSESCRDQYAAAHAS